MNINKEKLTEICEYRISTCVLYITIESELDSSIVFLAIEEEAPMFLQDGKEIMVQLDNSENQKADFVIFMKTEEMEIMVNALA